MQLKKYPSETTSAIDMDLMSRATATSLWDEGGNIRLSKPLKTPTRCGTPCCLATIEHVSEKDNVSRATTYGSVQASMNIFHRASIKFRGTPQHFYIPKTNIRTLPKGTPIGNWSSNPSLGGMLVSRNVRIHNWQPAIHLQILILCSRGHQPTTIPAHGAFINSSWLLYSLGWLCSINSGPTAWWVAPKTCDFCWMSHWCYPLLCLQTMVAKVSVGPRCNSFKSDVQEARVISNSFWFLLTTGIRLMDEVNRRHTADWDCSAPPQLGVPPTVERFAPSTRDCKIIKIIKPWYQINDGKLLDWSCRWLVVVSWILPGEIWTIRTVNLCNRKTRWNFWSSFDRCSFTIIDQYDCCNDSELTNDWISQMLH